MSSVSSLVLLDTSVVSFIYNRDPRASFYIERITGLHSAISFQTLEELAIWPIKNGWGARRRNDLAQHLDQYAVIWPTHEMVQISAELRAFRENIGRRLNTADAWIAATAVSLGCPLASHDRDFSEIPGLELIKSPNQ